MASTGRESATIKRGQVLATTIRGDQGLAAAQKYKNIIQLFVGIFSLAIISATIITWVFRYTQDRTVVLISLFQIPMIAEFIFASVIIPLYYRYWTRDQPRSGMSVLLGYVLTELITIMCGAAALFWRVIILPKHPNSCELVLLILVCISIAVAIVGIVLGLLLRREIEKRSAMHMRGNLLAISVDGQNNANEITLSPMEMSTQSARKKSVREEPASGIKKKKNQTHEEINNRYVHIRLD